MNKTKQKELTRNDEYEYFVLCNVKMQINRNCSIKNRIGYEIGVGQLCERYSRRMKTKEPTAEHMG